MIRLAATAMMIMLAGAAQAGERPLMPPSPMINPYGARAATTQPFAQNLTLGGKAYGLGDASLGDLASKIGALTPGHAGDGGESSYWLCYTLPDQHMRLWLSAGESRMLDSVTAQSSSAAPGPACPAPTARLAPVLLDNSLTIGADASDLKRKLGEPVRSDNGWWVYHRSVDMKTAGVDEDNLLVVHVEGGKIVFLMAERSATH